MMVLWTVVAVALAMLVKARIFGFRGQKPVHYAGLGPKFDPKRDLNGKILCEGVIYGPFGRVTSRFVAQMAGKWDGNRCVLTEHFQYDSGARQDREWQLVLGSGGTLRATAVDLVGAGRGVISGPAVQMRYKLRLPPEAGGYVITATDWMYLLDGGTIINRSLFTKFGLPVGELVATMRKVPE